MKIKYIDDKYYFCRIQNHYIKNMILLDTMHLTCLLVLLT